MANQVIKPRPPKGKFVIRENEGTESRWSIVLQYVVDGKTAKTTFGERIRKEQWSDRRQCVVSHPNQARLNNMLQKFQNEYDMLILEHFKKRQRICIKDLRHILANHRLPGDKTSIIEIGKDILANSKAQGRISASTYTNGISALKIFKGFITEKYPEWGDNFQLTDTLIDNYITWRKTVRGNSAETINKALTPLIKVAERLKLSEKMSSDMFDRISRMYLPPEKKSLSASEIDADNLDYLSHEDFARLLEYKDNCNLPRTRAYLDMFCFAVFTGLRWSDIVTLEWGHVDLERGILRKILVKGRRQTPLVISLTPQAIGLLMKWRERRDDKRFIFGLLDDTADLDDEDFLRNVIQGKGRSIMTVLARVAKEIGVDRLNFHKARHTFAIWALNDGHYDIKQISSMLGHSSVLTTETFYAQYIPDYDTRA